MKALKHVQCAANVLGIILTVCRYSGFPDGVRHSLWLSSAALDHGFSRRSLFMHRSSSITELVSPESRPRHFSAFAHDRLDGLLCASESKGIGTHLCKNRVF